MTDSLLLKPHEIQGIRIEGEPQICTSTGDNFFLYCSDNSLHTFDSTNLTNATLPQYDSNIESSIIISLAISPSKTTAAAGFNTGSIQVYDLVKNQLSKPFIVKEKNRSITNIVFLDDTTFLSVDESFCLRYFSLAATKSISQFASYLISKTLKDSFSIQLNSHVYQIIAAPVLNSKKNPNSFKDIVCITTESNLLISKISTSLPDKKEDIFVQKVKNATAAFSIQSTTSSLLCAYAAPCDISLITINSNLVVKDPVKQISNSIDKNPACINFLSENTLIVLFTDNSCLFTAISDFQSSLTTVPVSGKFIQGISSLFVFGKIQPDNPTKLYKIQMVTFENKIETFRENDDLESAIDLCRKAMAKDQSSIPGLPANELQRARVIERSISPFLQSRTQKILSEGTDQDASNQASSLISLAQELKMTDWITTEAVELYKEVNKLPIFFKLIISVDPDGKKFNYNSQFIELLLQDHDTLDIKSFIFSFPSAILPPKRLLQYGLDTKDSELLAQVYLKKLNDPLKCVMIYSHSNFESVFEVLLTYIDSKNPDDSNKLIKWVFSSSQEDKLPHMRAIIRAERTDVIDKMQNYIKASEKSYSRQQLPLNFEQFINSTIYACSLEEVKSTSKVHQLISSYIINNSINLSKTSIKYILSRVFTENSPEKDSEEQSNEKEAILFIVFNNNPDDQLLESLLPLCSSFGFKNARKKILMSLKKYDVLILDSIVDEGNGQANQDVFSFIQRLIRNAEINKDKEALINIKKSMLSNAILLISKDVNSFVNIILTYFALKDDEKELSRNTSSANLISSSSNTQNESDPNSIKVPIQEINEELLPLLKDESIKNHYLHALFSDERASHAKLDKKETKNYIEFLCRYFPDEVRRFIMNRDDVDVTIFLDICKQHKIIDALAVIYNKISETSTSLKYLHEFLEEKLYEYANSPADSNENTHFLDDTISFLSDIFSKGKIENAEEYCTMLIKSFVAPLYKVKDEPEKAQVLCGYLRKVGALSADRMSFDKILEIIVVEFSPLNLGVMRNILCGIINDYNYDIDTSKSLTLLFQQDELKAQDKYLEMTTHGTCYQSIFCPICNGLLIEGGDDGAEVFECGHIFHNSCLTKQVCPICNPEERIDQDIKKPTSELNEKQIFLRLKTFERKLAKRPL